MTIEEIIQKSARVDDRFSCGIYFLINAYDAIVYVGQSRSNIVGRINAHKKDKAFERYHVIECAAAELDEKEAHYISKFAPIYNRAIRTGDNLIFVKQVPYNVINHNGSMRYVVINKKLYADIDGLEFQVDDLPF